MQNRVISTWNTCLHVSQPSSVDFACKTATLAHELLVSIGSNTHLWFLHAKQQPLDQYTSLYVYQISPFVLCIQNSVINTRITSFYGFQPSSVVLCFQNSVLRTKIACLYGSQPSCVVFGCKTATFGLELQGSVGQRPHLLFLHSKLRLLDQNNKFLWVPDMTCHFVHVQQRA